MQLQTFNHPKLGPIQFTDSNEQTHSAKAKSNDITLVVSLRDRQQTAEVKQMIVDDINIKDPTNAISNRIKSQRAL